MTDHATPIIFINHVVKYFSKMVKKKRQSKRVPAAKRYKIERKVREHHRKVKKEAKKKTKRSGKKKKDPGIPNLYPFKEQVLKEIREKKEKAGLETQKRQREQRQKEQQKKRNLQSYHADVVKRTEEYEEKEMAETHMEHMLSQSNPDSSLKRFYKEFHKVVEGADVVLEVLDARDPLGCRCFEMEQTVLAAGSNKKLVLVLNKIDLVPRDNVVKWLKYLRNEFPTVAFKSNTQAQKHHLSHKHLQLHGSQPLEKSSVCLGAGMLMKLLGNYCNATGIQTSISVGVVGLPNVGKSSVINSLKRNRVCTVGSIPGVTRSMQEVQLDKHIRLLDSPGIIMSEGSTEDPSLALRNCVKVESLSDPVAPVEAIIKRCESSYLMRHYIVPEYSSTDEFLSNVAKRFGRLRKGGIPDVNAAAAKVLHDWNSGVIKFYTHPPEEQSLPAHISAEIVSKWSKAFDITGLQDEEEAILTGLAEKMDIALVLSS